LCGVDRTILVELLLNCVVTAIMHVATDVVARPATPAVGREKRMSGWLACLRRWTSVEQ